MNADELNALETLARKQSVAYKMLELNGGVGKLGVNHPEMFDDMLAWDEASENGHADTVLALIERVRYWQNEYETAEDMKAELRADLRRAQECIEKVCSDCKSALGQPGYGDYYSGMDSQAQDVLDILDWYDEGKTDD